MKNKTKLRFNFVKHSIGFIPFMRSRNDEFYPRNPMNVTVMIPETILTSERTADHLDD